MLVKKLAIKSISDTAFVKQKRINYCHAMRYYIKHINQPHLQEYIRIRWNMDSWEYESMSTDADAKINANKTQKEKNLSKQEEQKEKIENLQKELVNTKKKTKEYVDIKTNIFYATKYLNRLKKRENASIVFGGHQRLSSISYLHNMINKNELKELELNSIELKSEEVLKEIEKIQQEKLEYQNRLTNVYKQYESHRNSNFMIGGEAHHPHCNRKFEYEFDKNKVTFKPYDGKRIDIEYFCSDKEKMELYLIWIKVLENNKDFPVTIRLSEDYIWIHYSEQITANFSFKERECKEEYKKIKTKSKKKLEKEKNKIRIKYHKEQEDRMFADKLKSRYAGIDLNPKNMGFTIIDTEAGHILFAMNYDVSELHKRLNVSSDAPEQLKQNAKRKHEIALIYKDIFKKCKHFKVSHFVMEELDFKKSKSDKNKGFNRTTKNMWHRDWSKKQIVKRCNVNGIKLVEVQPQYSSFIGNMRYKFFDPVNSSLEIIRRGVNKFRAKSSLFPELKRTDVDAMSDLSFAVAKDTLRDVQRKGVLVREELSMCGTWKDVYDLFKLSGIKDWRQTLVDENHVSVQANSVKSGVVRQRFFNKDFCFIA